MEDLLVDGQEKLSISDFVIKGIHNLSKDGRPENGLHVVTSGLNGALHLATNGKKHPVQVINSLVRDGVILAKLAKGGATICDPRKMEPFDRKNCFCDVVVNLKGVEDRKAVKSIRTALQDVFAWTEVARLCNGQMTFVQGKKRKGGPNKKGMTYQSVHNGRIKLMMQYGANDTCYEYELVVPRNVHLPILVKAVQHAVVNSRTKPNSYGLDDSKAVDFAKKALETIVPGHLDGEKESDDDVFGLSPEKDETDSPKSNVVDLCDKSIRSILIAVEKKFNVNKEIPKSEFTKILTQELGLVEPSKQVLSGLVKRLSNSKNYIINLVRGTSKAKGVKGYTLTPKAKKIIKELMNKEQPILTEGSNVSIAKDQVTVPVLEQTALAANEELKAITVLKQEEATANAEIELQEEILKTIALKESDVVAKIKKLKKEQEEIVAKMKEIAVFKDTVKENLDGIRQEITERKEKLLDLL